MPLTDLVIGATKVSDLSPLRGMGLTRLQVQGNANVTDLHALEGMPLVELNCDGTHVADLTPLASCKSLKSLKVAKTQVTASAVPALQKALPNCKIEWDDPAKVKPPAPTSSGAK